MFLNGQDKKKKLLKIEFDFSGNYDDYITKYLPTTQNANDDKFDVLTNKNSTSLFYHFNSYLHSENRQVSLSNIAWYQMYICIEYITKQKLAIFYR